MLLEREDALLWTCNRIKYVDQGLFDISDTPYLIDVFQDEANRSVTMKSAQSRLSITTILRFMHRVATRGWNGIYYFPTDTAMYAFEMSRIKPLINKNEYLRKLIKNANSTTIKEIGFAFAYFFGLQGKTQKESTSADCEVFDEVDLMAPNDIEIAEERMAASPHQYVDYISTPSIPDFGIHALFLKSDQKFWSMKCPHCSTWSIAEELKFPECIEPGFLACRKCRKMLDTRIGEWVAKFPQAPISGRHVSRLFAKNANYLKIAEQYKSALNRQNFYNRVLGLPWSDKHTRINREDVLKLCGIDNMYETGSHTYVGIDQNPVAGHHITIGQKCSSHLHQIIWMGVLETLDDVPGILRKYDFRRGVIDAQPDLEGARKLCRLFPGRLFMCYYSETQKDEYKWDDEKQTVTVNRTESLDASQRLLRDGLVLLPRRSPTVETFADHCSNIARKLEVDEEKGTVKARYVQLGSDRPDHFRHAFNYESIPWYHGQSMPSPSAGIRVPGKVRSILEKENNR